MLRFILILAVLIILVVVMLSWSTWRFEQQYHQDVKLLLNQGANQSIELIQEKDLQHLPPPVQQYLRYVGVLNQPKVHNAYIHFTGRMRGRGKDWFPFVSKQYDGFVAYTRLFFMKGKMFGIKVPGYHRYKNHSAAMNIKLFGLLPVVKLGGETLFKTETVTLFNDMCLLAPATLIDPHIQWEAIDSNAAKAIFTNQGVSIQATLYFNESGQLINFVSDDRIDVGAMQQYRFSTPISKYRNYNGFKLASFGEAIWHYPEGKFIYGEFELQEVRYNN